MFSGGFIHTTAALHTAAAELGELGLVELSDDEVVTAIKDVEQCARMLTAVQHRLLAEARERSLPARYGVKSLKNFLMQTLRLGRADAGARVRQAEWVGPRRDLAGEPREPLLPHTARALAEGAISADHARGIAAVMNRIPRSVAAEDHAAAEEILAEFARDGSPDDIAKVGDRILAHLDPDGKDTTDRDRARMRGITIGRQRPDGMSPIRGEIDPVLRALLDPLLAKYARPGMCNPEDPESPGTPEMSVGSSDTEDTYIDPHARAEAAARDHRSPAQRNHDALKALLQSGIITDRLGAHRGLPVTTILTISVNDLETMTGVATTATGGTVPLRTALALAERSQPWLAVFDHTGLPLHLGRTKRLASPAQRLALIAALRGCSRPGCDAPASLCAVHHILDARHGGPTDIGNLTLACDACHALIHDGPGGWRTITTSPGSRYAGRTAWIAPHHIDPTGTPRINHRHHASELLAQTLSRIHQNDNRFGEQNHPGRRSRAPQATSVA